METLDLESSSDHPQRTNNLQMQSGIVARFIQIAAVFFIQGLLLFSASGNIRWFWSWLFLGICLVSVMINGSVILRYHPDTVAERGRPKNIKGWDKVISGLWGVAMYMVVPIVAGFDNRFRWTESTVNLWNIVGGAGLAIGLAFGGWAMTTNRFFSTVVRIQTDRGHTVCQSGPYRFIRHPGYLGFILQSLSTPALLGSHWALIPAISAVALLTLRTALEDQLLQSELPGYSDYAQQVRFRLIPGLW
jgi:protein-S-isoprenylcysteine O-methyltransferase Ste14